MSATTPPPTNYFTTDVTSGPLTAPAGGNGVYPYGSSSLFPTSTFQATNYWVDVIFNPAIAEHRRRRLSPTRAMPPRRVALPTVRAAPTAIGNVLTNDTDPDAGDTKTVTAVSFGAVNGTLGTALAGAYGSLVLNASGAFTYTVNENDAAVQALAAVDQYADRRLQLHHARHGRRHRRQRR